MVAAIGAAIPLARLLPGMRHASPDTLFKDMRVALPVQVAGYAALVAIMVLLVTLKNRGPFLKEISWNAPDRKRIWQAMAYGLALAVASTLAETLLSRWIPKSLPIEEYFNGPLSAYLLAAFGILVAPLVEELYFRGFLYPALARWTGVLPAVVLTSAGFALLHGAQLAYAVVPVLTIFVVGATLNMIRVRTGSVATGVIAHMTYNFVLFLQTFIGTDGFRHFDKH